MQNERKRLIPGSRGQFFVRVHGEEEWQEIFKWLNNNHYKNFHYFTENLYPKPTKVICIDEKEHSFYGTNVTCMACAVSGGHNVLDFEEFKIRHYWDIFVLTIDIQADYIIFFCQDRDMCCKEIYNSCYRLYFDKENMEKLISTLTKDCERSEFNFIKAIDEQYYISSHFRDWFELEEFEKFCSEKNIEYTKSIESIEKIYDYYKYINS